MSPFDHAWRHAASAGPPVIQSIATQATATPTTTNLTLTGSCNAFRVWTGETPHTEAGFNLYVVKNAGAVTTVRLYKWQGRIITGAAGDNFALGTDDGRTLQFAVMTVPGSLTAPAGVNGTANCDKAGPPLWTPANDHVTLPSPGSTFQINSDSTERIVFISEYDGSTWSWPRWVWVQTNANVRVQCTYAHIALANYDGATLSITAPNGSTVGGTSNYMTMGLPVVTGTTRTCSTVAEFQTAITNAVSGDRIVLNSGVYALTTNFAAASFAANNGVGGKVGAEGIAIVGASGIASDVIISNKSTGTGWFTLNQSGASGYTYLHSVTFDETGLPNKNPWTMVGGKFRLENVRFTGTNTVSGQQVQVDLTSASGGATADFLWCVADSGKEDLFSSTGNATYNSATSIRYIGCTATNAGAGTGSQCLTSHTGLGIYAYGCSLVEATLNIVASSDDTAPAYINFCRTGYGSRLGNFANADIYASYVCLTNNGSGSDIALVTNRSACFNHIYLGPTPATVFRSNANCTHKVEHNYVKAATTTGNYRAIHYSQGSVTAVGNIIDTFPTGFRMTDYSTGVKGNYLMANNSVVNTATAIDWSETTAGITGQMTNNACGTNTTSINCSATSMGLLTTDYNVLDANVDADYVGGANDIKPADAGLVQDNLYVPKASGNCDGNGLANLFSWVGDSDPYGFVLFYLTTRAPRGAREIPAIYANAVMFPDLW